MNRPLNAAFLASTKSALVLTCRNCGHQCFMAHEALAARIGRYTPADQGKFKCRICDNYNVNFSTAAEAVTVIKIDPQMHFAGVYENRLLD